MKTITLIHAPGAATRTIRVIASAADNHIAARDALAPEARILRFFENLEGDYPDGTLYVRETPDLGVSLCSKADAHYRIEQRFED